MATDKGTRLIRNDFSEVGVVAVVGLDGGPIGGGGGSGATAPVSTVQMTSLATAVNLTGAVAAVAAGATQAWLVPNGQGIYVDPAGGTPSATLGMPIPVGAYTRLFGTEITLAKVVQQAASATLNVYYSK